MCKAYLARTAMDFTQPLSVLAAAERVLFVWAIAQKMQPGTARGWAVRKRAQPNSKGNLSHPETIKCCQPPNFYRFELLLSGSFQNKTCLDNLSKVDLAFGPVGVVKHLLGCRCWGWQRTTPSSLFSNLYLIRAGKNHLAWCWHPPLDSHRAFFLSLGWEGQMEAWCSRPALPLEQDLCQHWIGSVMDLSNWILKPPWTRQPSSSPSATTSLNSQCNFQTRLKDTESDFVLNRLEVRET